MKWKDTTTRCRGDYDSDPTTWTTEIGDLRITVTSGHIHYPGQWIMHCHRIGMDTVPIPGKNAEDAQRAALERVRKKIASWHSAISLIEREETT